jgi:hypothetical protein
MANKLIERFIPFLVVGEGEHIFERPLKPRETREQAEEALRAALIKEQPGCMGEIRHTFVCVAEEKPGLILPESPGKLKVIN